MDSVDLLSKYFPSLTQEQLDRFTKLGELYPYWNAQINVISRKDIDSLYEHHILHSLGIAQMIRFKPGTSLLDFGTGGGFPGIPLAILFPECQFLHARGEEIQERFDFVVSRAVMRLDELVGFTRKLVHHEHRNGMPNGLICLKGGELQAEIRPYKRIVEVHELYPTFSEEFFKTKKVVYLPL